MNTHQVKWVLCVLVVGLLATLETTALAGPPSMEYRPGVNSVYRSYGYNTVPQVRVPLYQVSDCYLPTFCRGSTGNRSVTPKVKQPHPGLLSNMYVVPDVRVPTYELKDCYRPH